MTSASDKIMFEIYRERDGERVYRVVYFTDLDDHNKDKEINDAMNGDYYFDGFIALKSSPEAKSIIARTLTKLNNGELVEAEQLRRELAPFVA